MSALTLCLAAALVASAVAEPPSGYSYGRPSGGGGGGGIGGGGNYIEVSSGYSSNEGSYVDPQLLEKIRAIILKEESAAGPSYVGGSGGGGGGGHPSSQYGAPSPQYGVPGYYTRVVGVDLEGIRQAIQVAQYQQTSYAAGGGGYPAATYAAPSSSYGAPSSSYGSPY
ncbi:pro-resilin [Bacillus rossius redtenbacheri]|uniref:pro-resilin n=1 Tax=Bacillus rossius redtenbacheri TaxID=93214 RepID=UPI002FDEB65E